MLLEITRVYTMETLRVKIEQLEERIADGLEELLPLLSELQRMYRLASEEGELEYEERFIVKYDPKVHSRIFSEKTVELLKALAHGGFYSVSELARHLNRDVANVYRDVKTLEALGLVALVRRGKTVKPVLLAKRICLRYG